MKTSIITTILVLALVLVTTVTAQPQATEPTQQNEATFKGDSISTPINNNGGSYHGCPRIWKFTSRGMEVIGKEACEQVQPCTNLICMAKRN